MCDDLETKVAAFVKPLDFKIIQAVYVNKLREVVAAFFWGVQVKYSEY